MAEPLTTTQHAVACPYCGRPNDRHSGVGSPSPGDAAICWGCGGIAIITEGLGQRTATNAELAAFESDPDFVEVYRQVSRWPTPSAAVRAARGALERFAKK